MKMILNNKFEGNNELVGIKSSEKTSDIDALFAELFALVNLESIDTKKTSFEELNTNKIDEQVDLIGSNKKTINVAKSLAEVFYKELGIDNQSSNKEYNDQVNVKNIVDKGKGINLKELRNFNLSTNLKNAVSLKENKKEPQVKNNQEINKNFSEQKIVKTQNLEIKIKKIVKNEKINFESEIQKINSPSKTNKNPEIDQLKNNNSNTTANRVKSSKETSILLKEKKINKKGKDRIAFKNNNEQEIISNKINKDVPIKIIGNIARNPVKNSSDTSLNLKSSNENKTKSSEKNFVNNQNFNTKETLDLLESSWGEKFTKIIKNSIDRGISKLNFDLKPKNLGKLSLEITIKDSKTSIQINTENQEAANILNDNLSKLTDLIEEKNSKFSLLNDGSNHSNYFNQQKQRQNDRQENTLVKKKEVNELKKIKMNNYSIDVNA